VAQYLPVFVAGAADTDQAGRLPAFVRREFEAYLACGRLDHGCVHVRCERCGDDMVAAFSCKRARRLPLLWGPPDERAGRQAGRPGDP
jgi:hypothetical protein